MPLGRVRAHQAQRTLGVERARVLVVARREPVREHECRHTPVVEDLGDVRAFAAVHQHDVAAAGRDDDGAAIRRARARREHSQKGSVQRAVALRGGDLSDIPQGNVTVLGRIRGGEGGDREKQRG
jgi:hypothetical protein